MRLKFLTLLAFFVSAATPVFADFRVNMIDVSSGESVGTVLVKASQYGVLLTPDLHGLVPGPHGFHIHVNPSCAKAGMAAGGHFDPEKTNLHRGPYQNDGHLGDLPVLIVDQEGRAQTPVLAPRLKVADFYGHSLMVHAGGDNYADTPKHLGGGGMRMVCGVIKETSKKNER